jgi:hypothetical protein
MNSKIVRYSLGLKFLNDTPDEPSMQECAAWQGSLQSFATLRERKLALLLYLDLTLRFRLRSSSESNPICVCVQVVPIGLEDYVYPGLLHMLRSGISEYFSNNWVKLGSKALSTPIEMVFDRSERRWNW